jgi:aspartate carbamoyltransferase catalytic subunit
MFTIRQHKGKVEGLTVAIVGDIYHSRVARSDILALKKLGAKVILCGPPTLVPRHFADMGVEMSYDLMKAIADADVIYSLRMQFERQQANFLPSIAEYIKLFGLTTERLKHARKDCIVMHPGPINRGIEMTSEVADSPRSVILDQVTNGVAVRMAVMFLLARAAG